MKNIITSFIIFIIMITGIFFSSKHLTNVSNQLLKQTNSLETIVTNEKWEDAYKMSISLLNKWKKEHRKLSVFVHHEEIDDINNELLQLTQYVKCKDKSESLAKIHVIKFFVNNIIELEKVNLQNIF
ncbi:DUF4363 family protein [Haloimpatiens sp. FM7330]|uniref:DUF4363 family protein n=1 Tax=Haloimpatiens sp. FM7330 TaxID=3298610 RepID=UPI00362DF88B